MRTGDRQALCRPTETKKTIPRLELLGFLALTRIYSTCQEALAFINFKDYDKTFWLDSRTVLEEFLKNNSWSAHMYHLLSVD